MTKQQAIKQILQDADRTNKVLSSNEITILSLELIERHNQEQRKRNEFNVLSAKNSGSRVMKPITTLNALTMPVLRDLTVSSAAEFLGEEFWLSLDTMKEKLVAKRVFNEMRAKITRNMC